MAALVNQRTVFNLRRGAQISIDQDRHRRNLYLCNPAALIPYSDPRPVKIDASLDIASLLKADSSGLELHSFRQFPSINRRRFFQRLWIIPFQHPPSGFGIVLSIHDGKKVLVRHCRFLLGNHIRRKIRCWSDHRSAAPFIPQADEVAHPILGSIAPGNQHDALFPFSVHLYPVFRPCRNHRFNGCFENKIYCCGASWLV